MSEGSTGRSMPRRREAVSTTSRVSLRAMMQVRQDKTKQNKTPTTLPSLPSEQLRCDLSPRSKGHLQAGPLPGNVCRSECVLLRISQRAAPPHRVTWSSFCFRRSQIRDQRSARPLGQRALLWPAQPQPVPLACSRKRRHDKMVAALLHRELRVPPWATQRGLLGVGCVITVSTVSRGARKGASFLSLGTIDWEQ